MSSSLPMSKRVLLFLAETVFPTIVLLAGLVAFYLVLGAIMGTSTPVRLVQIDMQPWYVTSMFPALVAGDVILVEGITPEEVNVGDVIIFSRSYSPNPIIHRVIQIVEMADGQRAFRTKGDYNPIPDTSLVGPEDVLGRWTGIKVQLIGLPIIVAQDTVGRLVIIGLILALSLHSFLNPEAKEPDVSESQTNQVSE